MLDRGGSELVSKIARKWGMSIDEASINIKIRALIKQKIAAVGDKHPEFMESDMVIKANNAFCLFCDQIQNDNGKVDFHEVYKRWMSWYFDFVDRNKKMAG